MTEHFQDTSLSRESALEAVAAAAELWGAAWSRDGWGGRLELPVVSGVRRGVVAGHLRVDSTAEGSRMRFREEGSRQRLNLSALAVLALGAAGGIVATLWPFFPGLLALAPIGLVLALAAWLLVVSRLRTSGPREFLELAAGLEDPEEAAQASLTRASDAR